MRKLLIGLMVGLLAGGSVLWAVPLEQVNTTSFQTLSNKTFTAPIINDGTLSAPSIGNPTITGTVGGSATYSTPTLSNPTLSGTVGGSAIYTSPTLTGPTLTGPTLTDGTIQGSIGAGSGLTLPQFTAGGPILDLRPQSYTKAGLPAAGTTGRLARVTDDVRGLWMDTGTQWFPLNAQIVNVKEFGAKGDNSTDDLAAINAAIAALGSDGGVVYFPPGIYVVSAAVQPTTSNLYLVGAGPGATTIKNTSLGIPPASHAIWFVGTLGTNYAINAPTQGTFTVTTTTAGNAGNFMAGEEIAVSGNSHNGDYIPFLLTTVVSVDGGTGVITLADAVRRTEYTTVHKLTNLLRNVGVMHLTAQGGGDNGSLFFKYARGVRVVNVHVRANDNSSAACAGCRDAVWRDSVFDASANFHSSMDSSIQGSVLHHTDTSTVNFPSLTIDGGSHDVAVGGNHFVGTSGQTGSAIQINAEAESILVAENTFRSLTAIGVLVSGDDRASQPAGYGHHIIANNTFVGVGGTAFAGISIGGSNDNIVAGNRIRHFDYGIFNGGSSLRLTITGNRISDITTSAFGESGTPTYLGFKDILTGSASLNFGAPSVSPGTAVQIMTVTGAAVGDPVVCSTPVTAPNTLFVFWAAVTSANTVSLHWVQIDQAAVDPDGAGGTYRCDVWKH